MNKLHSLIARNSSSKTSENVQNSRNGSSSKVAMTRARANQSLESWMWKQCGSDFITDRKRAGEEADREQSSTNFQPRFSVPFTMMTQVFRAAKLWCRCVSIALSRLAINLIVYKQKFLFTWDKKNYKIIFFRAKLK